jgi:Glyoxalase-like domain
VSGVDIRIQCLCVDSTDPKKIAPFWEAALGWRRTWDEEDQIVLEPPEGSREDGIAPDLLFLRDPEGN